MQYGVLRARRRMQARSGTTRCAAMEGMEAGRKPAAAGGLRATAGEPVLHARWREQLADVDGIDPWETILSDPTACQVMRSTCA